MHNRFRFQMGFIMIIFAVLTSVYISYVDLRELREGLMKENESKISLMEDNIKNALSSIDNALSLFDQYLSEDMALNTSLLIKKYEQNPHFNQWDLKGLAQEFKMDVFIINEENTIVYGSSPEGVGINFNKCCSDFTDILNNRRESGRFYKDSMDTRIGKGELMTWSYQATPDKKYIIQLGVSLENNELLERFNFLNVLENFEEKYPSFNQITIYSRFGDKIGMIEGELRIPVQFLDDLTIAYKTQKRVVVEDTIDGKKVYRMYTPYHALDTRGTSTDRIIEIIYNHDLLDKEISKMNKRFALKTGFVVMFATIVAIVISHMVSKPMYLAFHDPLTGLRNRASFELICGALIEKKKRIGLLLIDLDNFKLVNDQLGHDTGDDLLKYIAIIMASSIPKNCSAYRIGGDEFIVLIENVKDDQELEEVANIVRQEMINPTKRMVNTTNKMHFSEEQVLYMLQILDRLKVTMSVGGAIYPEHAEDLEGLYKKADLALYSTKEREKNGYSLYSSE